MKNTCQKCGKTYPKDTKAIMFDKTRKERLCAKCFEEMVLREKKK